MRMAVIHGGRRHAGQEDEVAATDDDARRVRHVDVAPAVGVVDDGDLFRHRSGPSKLVETDSVLGADLHLSPFSRLLEFLGQNVDQGLALVHEADELADML